MNSTERDLPEDKLRERLLGIVAGPNPALTPRQRAAIRDAADALASIRAERDAAVAALKQCGGIFEDMYRYGVVYTPSADDKGEFTSAYYLGEGIMPMIARAIAGEQKNDA